MEPALGIRVLIPGYPGTVINTPGTGYHTQGIQSPGPLRRKQNVENFQVPRKCYKTLLKVLMKTCRPLYVITKFVRLFHMQICAAMALPWQHSMLKRLGRFSAPRVARSFFVQQCQHLGKNCTEPAEILAKMQSHRRLLLHSERSTVSGPNCQGQ